jgi:DNA-directed RNA polymerase specialized sigma24 family protein
VSEGTDQLLRTADLMAWDLAEAEDLGAPGRLCPAVLLDALAGLPARPRAIIVLRYWEDLPEAEVAAIPGCSVGTVKSTAP